MTIWTRLYRLKYLFVEELIEEEKPSIYSMRDFIERQHGSKARQLEHLHQTDTYNKVVAMWEIPSICATCQYSRITQTVRQNEPRIFCSSLETLVDHDMVRCNMYRLNGAEDFSDLLSDWKGILIGEEHSSTEEEEVNRP